MRAIKQFVPRRTENATLNRIQEAIREPLNTLIANPVNSAPWMAKIKLLTGTNFVTHGLGRKYESYWTGNQTGGGRDDHRRHEPGPLKVPGTCRERAVCGRRLHLLKAYEETRRTIDACT
jgi:hypothetical protein